LARGRSDLIERFEKIPSLTPGELLNRFADGRPREIRAIGAGFNGIVFANHKNETIKLNFAVLAALGKVSLQSQIQSLSDMELQLAGGKWRVYFDIPAMRDVDVPALRRAPSEPLGSQPLMDELYGTLVWAVFNPEFTEFPGMISDDGLAFTSKWIDGVPLIALLRSQRENGDLHQKYDFKRIWKQVVHWQAVSEVMVRSSGYTVDMFTPGNFMVTGDPKAPVLRPIDTALARPTDEALAWYESQGWHVPKVSTLDSAMRVIVWPTMPEHVVSSVLWGLDFRQAIEYVRAAYGFPTDHLAIQKMATFQPWKIVEAPFLGDYANIENARRLRTRVKSRFKSWWGAGSDACTGWLKSPKP
jgi:hypothetical protein